MSLDHPVFGKLRHKDEAWRGRAKLPRFAAVGRLPDEPPMGEAEQAKLAADMEGAVGGIREAMGKLFGPSAAAAFEALDEEQAEALEPNPRQDERDRKRAEREAKAADRLRRGLFPFEVADEGEDGPTEQQAAAFRHLCANESAAYDAVAASAFESFQQYYRDERWREMCGLKPASGPAELAGQYAITNVIVRREYHNGTAYLQFILDCPWEVEHGMNVVYHPDKPAEWATYDGLDDLLESDDAEEPQPYVETPYEQLMGAVAEGDDAKARELIAGGASLNDMDPEAYPPLWIAVDQIDANEVRQLLHYGADPNLTTPAQKRTPLRHAKSQYKQLGFGDAPKKKDKLFDAMMEMAMANDAVRATTAKMKADLEEIMRLLEAAGGK